MSSTIYLVRHGIAEDPSADLPDEERRLTTVGMRKMARAAVGLKRMGVQPEIILSSGLRRADETAGILASVLKPHTTVETFPTLGPGHAPAAVLRALSEYAGAHSVMLVGHEPNMSELLARLLIGAGGSGSFAFKKGAVAAIRVSSIPPRASGVLGWFLTPKQLRAVAR